MKLFPAIDLMNKQCVRLTHGDFSTTQIYENDPVLVAKNYAEQGAQFLHIVDLEGAKQGDLQQLDIIKSIALTSNLDIQVGGGIRDQSAIEKLFSFKIARVILGSIAVKDIDLVSSWIKLFGTDSICLALDVKFINDVPMVMTHGWQEASNITLWQILDAYKSVDLKHVLCTDISLDGTLTSPNFSMYEEILSRYSKIKLQASGGVSSLEDLRRLKNIGVDGVIIGKALYENKFTLQEALTC